MPMAHWISGQGNGTQSQHVLLTICAARDIWRTHSSSPVSAAPAVLSSPALPLQPSVSPSHLCSLAPV